MPRLQNWMEAGISMSEATVRTHQISVVMPVFDGEKFLQLSLPALIKMQEHGEIIEVLVVDDGSHDRSAKIAADLGARIIRTGGRKGAAAARNLGVEHATGDIIWFVDADLVAHEDGARIISNNFSDPEVSAVFGSYDDSPVGQNFLSQYKNLVHHYYHQQGSRKASTFWAGCGAIHKVSFQDVGGFDAEVYKLPAIEDIELGYRLCAAGYHIRLAPELQGKHLKLWHFGNLLHTDIFQRAIPWSRLILKRSMIVNDLNTGVSERWRAALAGILALGLLGATIRVVPWSLPAGMLLLAPVANWPLFRFFRQRNGSVFAIAAILYHQLYYLYSLGAFAWTWFEITVLKRLMLVEVP
jgi:glycosyltransferase involved in cell wall biosynthesis